MELKPGQAPDLNLLQPHPDKVKIDLARVADAAEEIVNPSTPGQRAAVSGEGGINLDEIRRKAAFAERERLAKLLRQTRYPDDVGSSDDEQ